MQYRRCKSSLQYKPIVNSNSNDMGDIQFFRSRTLRCIQFIYWLTTPTQVKTRESGVSTNPNLNALQAV